MKKKKKLIPGLINICEEEELKRVKKRIISDEESLKKLAKEAIAENPKAVEDFQKGKESVLQALIGTVMRKSSGKADASKVAEILLKYLRNV